MRVGRRARAIATIAERAGRSGIAVAALFAAAFLAGCTTSGQGPAAFAQGGGMTVAFESIDGPPQSVFQKFVQGLEAEAQARQVAVVSREGPARYRIRGYLAAHVRRGRASFAWVWDVYDAEQRRALRIAGEETAGQSGRNAWAAADEAMLRRIAQAGMERLAAFLHAGGAATARAGADNPPTTMLAQR